MTLDRLLYILDDAQHPDAPPTWAALVVLCITLLLIRHLWRLIQRWRVQHSTDHLHRITHHAHYQKQHEGERW